MTPRSLALSALDRGELSPGFQERYLEEAFSRNPQWAERDRAFTVHLVQGVLRWRLRLDWIIKQFVHFPFAEIKPSVLNILRLALYQIFFLNRVPESAAVNEAVNQAKARGKRHLVGFVNGILRNICRHKDEISYPNPETDRVLFLSVFHSYPQWLVEKWMRELGSNAAEYLLEAGNRIPSFDIRTNTLKTNPTNLLRDLGEAGISARPAIYAPEGLNIERLSGSVAKLREFKAGFFQVQGEAAQVCSHLISPRPGERVLDLCAGLGGKSTHMAQLMENKGRICALDVSHRRLVRLAVNAKRLGVSSVWPVAGDACWHLSDLFRCSFDKIVIDGPCSGLGVISRHPDGKWIRDETDIERLAQLQGEILKQAIPLLREDGEMLYVTCTISREENEGVVWAFLKSASGMVMLDLRKNAPGWAAELIDEQGFLRTFPHTHNMDGFFGALFRKKED